MRELTLHETNAVTGGTGYIMNGVYVYPQPNGTYLIGGPANIALPSQPMTPTASTFFYS